MPTIPSGNVVIGQSGGPTAVINQSLVGVVETLRGKPGIQKILGARHAVRGMVKDDFIELQDVPQERLERIAGTPSAALGSSRDKPDAEYCRKIFEVLARKEARYFFYIGGNDSSDTCRIISELAQAQSVDLRCFHVPKTIDNDLMMNDHTPGFGSAAKFVACAFIGDNLDNRSLPGIKLNVVMGRHAGFLTAASVLARQGRDDGPHLIYVPEAPFNVDRFIADVDRVYSRLGRCLIAISEGIHDERGTPIAVKLADDLKLPVERDAHGNVALSGTGVLGDFLSQAIKKRLGEKHPKLRVRADTFGYVQRCYPLGISEVDQHEARQVGRHAAQLALDGHRDGSIAIQRVSSHPYTVAYPRVELRDIAAKTRTLEPAYIRDGCDIDPSFRDYLLPIVGRMPIVETLA